MAEFDTFGTGFASLSFFARACSEEERQEWAREDADRDARRVPLGFASVSAQEPACGDEQVFLVSPAGGFATRAYSVSCVGR